MPTDLAPRRGDPGESYFDHPDNDLRVVAAVLGVRLHPRGDWSAESVRCHCPSPAHPHGNRKGTLRVWPTGFKCIACGESGNTLDFITFASEMTRDEATQWVRERAGAVPPRRSRRKRRPPSSPSRSPSIPPKPLRENLVAPSPARLRLMRSLWGVLEDHPGPRFTDATRHWLVDARGVGTLTAWELGCRDFLARPREVAAILNAASDEDLVAAGLLSDTGKPWAPLLHAWPGLMIPHWHPDHPFPVGWRWRRSANVCGLKSLSPFGRSKGSDGALAGLPFGLRTASPHLVAATEPGAVVFVVEGEMDWLAIHDAAGAVNGGVRVAALGLHVAKVWRGQYRTWLQSARCVIAALHTSAGVEDAVASIVATLPDALRIPLGESYDLADANMAGRTEERARRGLGSHLSEALPAWIDGATA